MVSTLKCKSNLDQFATRWFLSVPTCWMLQKHPRTVELGGFITFLSGRSIFRGQASGISIPSCLAHTPSTSRTHFMLQNPKSHQWSYYSEDLNNLQQGFLKKKHLQAVDHQIYLIPCHNVLVRRPTSAHSKNCRFSKATSVPWLKQSHVEPRPRSIGGTESIFHDFSTWKAEVNTGKDPQYHPWDWHICLHEWLFFMAHAGEYSVHGCYGINIWEHQLSHWEFGRYSSRWLVMSWLLLFVLFAYPKRKTWREKEWLSWWYVKSQKKKKQTNIRTH